MKQDDQELSQIITSAFNCQGLQNEVGVGNQ